MKAALASVLGWRWTPFFAITGASILYVLVAEIAVAAVMSPSGDEAKDDTEPARDEIVAPIERPARPPSTAPRRLAGTTPPPPREVVTEVAPIEPAPLAPAAMPPPPPEPPPAPAPLLTVPVPPPAPPVVPPPPDEPEEEEAEEPQETEAEPEPEAPAGTSIMVAPGVLKRVVTQVSPAQPHEEPPAEDEPAPQE
jgi:hypothetical protein